MSLKKGHLILIVDDEEDLLEMYQEFFEMEDFEVRKSSSAEAAIEVLKENPNIEVVISDAHMDGMSGMELLKFVKENSQQMPNFYLSTGDMNFKEEDVKLVGGKGLVLKPFELDAIIKRIKKDLAS